MLLGSIVAFLEEIKCCKTIVSLLAVIICCKTIKLGPQWRSKAVRLYLDVPGRDQML